MTKEELRAVIKTHTGDHTTEDAQTTLLLNREGLLAQADIVFAFCPLRSEVNITPLFSLYPLALPRSLEDGSLEFIKVAQPWEEHVQPGKYGIKEPKDGPVVTPTERTIILVPGMAFSRDGKRLGRGKGFYDRYLSRYPEAYTIGICRKENLVDDIPTEPWDRTMDAVIAAGAWALAPAKARRTHR